MRRITYEFELEWSFLLRGPVRYDVAPGWLELWLCEISQKTIKSMQWDNLLLVERMF